MNRTVAESLVAVHTHTHTCILNKKIKIKIDKTTNKLSRVARFICSFLFTHKIHIWLRI